MSQTKICLGCMNSMGNGEKCERCGFDRREYEAQRPLRVLPSGTVLAERYMLGKALGIGGFGITYLAMDFELQKPVAIKEFFPNGLAERTILHTGEYTISVSGVQQKQYYEQGLQSFVREANTMLMLKKYDGIVQVYHFFEENNTAYLVMEYLPGMSLRSYVKISGLPLGQENVLEMIWPVLNSLAMIHRKGMVHRDISPDNIIYGPDGRITLIDFGAARQATSDSNKSLTIMLKHGYAPMEQYYTQGKQGAWTDIYAICATIYYLLSGIVPPDSISRFADDRLKPLYTINAHISKSVSDAVSKGLAVRYEDRYQTIEELITDLYAGMYEIEIKKDVGSVQKKASVQSAAEKQYYDELFRNMDETVKQEENSSERKVRKNWERTDIVLGIVACLSVGAAITWKLIYIDTRLWMLLMLISDTCILVWLFRFLRRTGWKKLLPTACIFLVLWCAIITMPELYNILFPLIDFCFLSSIIMIFAYIIRMIYQKFIVDKKEDNLGEEKNE